MTQTARLTLLPLLAALGLGVLTACNEQQAAVKQDRETDNLYTRLETIRLAYGDGVHRRVKADRFQSQGAAAIAEAPKLQGAQLRPLQTAALFATPRHFAISRKAETRLIAFNAAPFPYEGRIGRSDQPFYNVIENGKRGHRTPYNRIYWEDETYSDPRVLLHVPRGFDIGKPGLIVLFFHGHGARLERDVIRRQQVPKQISEAGVNAVLVAPQLAVDARDSSPGKFWEPGGVKRFLSEAADKLAELYGDGSAKATFERMPVVIVAYSGGYMPAAWAIARGGFGSRLQGIVLLDALYGHLGTFRNWIAGQNSGFFVSAYANATRTRNQNFQTLLTEHNIPVRAEVGPGLDRDSVVFLSTDPDTAHEDFVTKAWVDYPIKNLLQHMQFDERGLL